MKHAFKNALIPIITVLGLTFAMLISGAVVTENVFNLPGIGNLVVSAVLRRDYPVIQGALLVVAGLYVLINFLIDMLYLLVDPRVTILMAATATPPSLASAAGVAAPAPLAPDARPSGSRSWSRSRSWPCWRRG